MANSWVTASQESSPPLPLGIPLLLGFSLLKQSLPAPLNPVSGCYPLVVLLLSSCRARGTLCPSLVTLVSFWPLLSPW